MDNIVDFVGITFVDIDKGSDWSFYDYNCRRVPNKGDVMSFRHIVGNNITYYHGEVLYVMDSRDMWGEKEMQDCDIKSQSITVVMREIKGELGNKTYLTMLEGLSKQKK